MLLQTNATETLTSAILALQSVTSVTPTEAIIVPKKQVQISNCDYCHRRFAHTQKSARFCSARCRIAQFRKVRKLERLKREIADLENELDVIVDPDILEVI